MMTSEKLFVDLERSSVELLEEGLRLSWPLAGRPGLEGTGGVRRLAVREGGEAVRAGRSLSGSGITRAGEARTESDPGEAGPGGGGLRTLWGGGATAGDEVGTVSSLNLRGRRCWRTPVET